MRNIIGLILWGFAIAIGFWLWNAVCARYLEPKIDKLFEKLEKKAEA